MIWRPVQRAGVNFYEYPIIEFNLIKLIMQIRFLVVTLGLKSESISSKWSSIYCK